MSDAFAYLTGLISIILGLAMAEILHGYRMLLLARGNVKLYAPSLIWSGIMLVLAVHFWWASFGLAKRDTWDFDAFAAVLLQAVMMFMGSTLIFPMTYGKKTIDLRAHYYHQATPFFTFGLLFLATGFLKDWLLDQKIENNDSALGFFIYFTAMTLVALFVRKPRIHEGVAPAMAAGVVVFIVMMFFRIGPSQ
jgi:hypothetical protein